MTSSDSNEIQINVKGPSELKLQISISTDKTVKELKEAIAKSSSVEAERQRLIYSGRVLKDEDLLSVYKIQSGNTLHMVKGVAKSSGSSSSESTPQQLPPMQAGQNPADPLTQLNSHLGHGLMAGFNPFAELGVNPADPNMMQGLLDSPQFVEQMSRMMSDPSMVEQLIATNPSMAPMANQLRQVFANPQFQTMVSNPETLRAMIRMSSAMQNAGAGAGSGSSTFNNPWFPPPVAPGTTDTTTTGQTTTPAGQGAAALAGLLGQTPAGGNPFGMVDPNLLQQMFGGLGGGSNSLGVGGVPPTPADTRPLEERFQTQLQQLQDMGFVNASQNIRALLATGGNVHAAIEYILGGGGL